MVSLLGVAVFAQSGQAASTEVVVGAGGSERFAPNDVTITAGDTVNFRWEDGGHNVQIDTPPEQFNSGFKNNGATYSRTFTNPGTYVFYCAPHGSDNNGRPSGMAGRLTVVAAPPPPGGGGTTTPPPDGGTTTPGTGGSTSGGSTGSGSSSGTAAGSGGDAATGASASSTTGTRQTADPGAPLVRLVRATFRRGAGLRLTVRLSEAATVHVGLRRRGAKRAVTRRFAARAGTNRLRVNGLRRGRYRLRVVAVDAAGNRSAPRTRTLLVKR